MVCDNSTVDNYRALSVLLDRSRKVRVEVMSRLYLKIVEIK